MTEPHEKQMQFRVGMFTLLAIALTVFMVFQFGELSNYFRRSYPVAIHFESGAGMHASSRITQNGIPIGTIREVRLDNKYGGVLAICDIREEFKIRDDSRPQLSRSLLGESTIDFSTGTSRMALKPGSRIEGIPASDPMQVVGRLEKTVGETLQAFAATSNEWRQVAANVNSLVDTNRGNLGVVMERTAESLHQFTLTMKNANQTMAQAGKLLSNPSNQKALQETLAALPQLVNETRSAVTVVRQAVLRVDSNLTNLSEATKPLADNSKEMATKLTRTISNLESLTGELNAFAVTMRDEDGSLKKFIEDPALYTNLNQSAGALNLLLKNSAPIMRDLRIFSDKVARHPELIGVRGAIRGSSGIKEAPDAQPTVPSRTATWGRNLIPSRE